MSTRIKANKLVKVSGMTAVTAGRDAYDGTVAKVVDSVFKASILTHTRIVRFLAHGKLAAKFPGLVASARAIRKQRMRRGRSCCGSRSKATTHIRHVKQALMSMPSARQREALNMMGVT